MNAIVLTLAWRNLWRHPARTVLTAGAIALGLALLLIMLALGDGSHLQMIDAAVRMGSGHVLLQSPGYQHRRLVEQTVPEATVKRAVGWAGSRPGVRAVLPRAFASALLSSADGATTVGLVGVDPLVESETSRFARRVRDGRFLGPQDRRAVVLGSGVARALVARAGSRVVAMAQGVGSGEVHSALLTVAGIVHTGLDEVDETLALMPLPALQAMLDLGGAVHQIALVLDDHRHSAAWARDARAVIPDLEALTWADADPQLDTAIRLDNGSHYLFNGIFFVITGSIVLNTLSMAMLERRREIALLGALGLSPRRRVAMVLGEALILALVASAVGLGLGLAGHAYFHFHGLPLAWFTERELETAGVVLEPVLRSALSARRIAGSCAVVLALALALAILVGRSAGHRVDASLLK